MSFVWVRTVQFSCSCDRYAAYCSKVQLTEFAVFSISSILWANVKNLLASCLRRVVLREQAPKTPYNLYYSRLSSPETRALERITKLIGSLSQDTVCIGVFVPISQPASQCLTTQQLRKSLTRLEEEGIA